MTLKTLLSLKFRVGKPTGLVRATDSVGLPAQWIFQGHHSLFHTYLLFYFRVLTAIRDVSPPPPPFSESQINTTSPKPDSVVCVWCRPEHILAFLVAKVKNISVCS